MEASVIEDIKKKFTPFLLAHQNKLRDAYTAAQFKLIGPDPFTMVVEDRESYHTYGVMLAIKVKRNTSYGEDNSMMSPMYFNWVPSCCGAMFLHGMRFGTSYNEAANDMYLDFLTNYCKGTKGMWSYYVASGQEALKKYLLDKGWQEGSPMVHNPNSGNQIQLLYRDMNK